MSPIEALRELNYLYRVYIKDKNKGFKISCIVALNKKQEKIIKCINPKLLKECSV